VGAEAGAERANPSASSFPGIPAWPGTQIKSVLQLAK